jgi:formylmethanofuran dehydrogenase subunit B
LGGKVTCTLGEVKQRADFIVYWGGTRPSAIRAISPSTRSCRRASFCRAGKDRTMVLVDIRETKSAKAADIFCSCAR